MKLGSQIGKTRDTDLIRHSTVHTAEEAIRAFAGLDPDRQTSHSTNHWHFCTN